MSASKFDKWFSRSKTPKYPDGRTTRLWSYQDYVEFERVQLLRNAFKAGQKAAKAKSIRGKPDA